MYTKTKNSNMPVNMYSLNSREAMNNDLDMPGALSQLWNLLRDENAEGKIQTIKKFDEIFGLDLLKKEKINVPDEIQALVEKREAARREKSFRLADALRQDIKERGYWVEDAPEGLKIKKL